MRLRSPAIVVVILVHCSVLLARPASADATSVVAPVLVLGVVGGVVVETLPVVAQFQTDEVGQVEMGWAVVQTVMGTGNLGAGLYLVAESNPQTEDAKVAIGAGLIGFGSLWTGLGAYNVLSHEGSARTTAVSWVPAVSVSTRGEPTFGLSGVF